ncbi:MAG: Bax inhibitor-1/YccA family protein [Xanthobacteraceae bacterium]
MSDFDRNYAAARRGVGADRAVAIDEGLRAYMIRVYNYMAMGVALTGIVSWLTFQAAVVTNANGAIVGLTAFGQMIFSGPAVLVLFLGTLGLVFLISWRINSLQPSTAFALFMVYAGLLGLMLSTIFLTYTGASITRVFFISAAAFGSLSLYGYTTQRDLSPIGSFLMMGLIGLIIAMLVNLFLKSTGLDFVISAVGVLIFAGLTAWDTQRIKEMYDPREDGTIVGRKAVMGALSLYLDFINLFLFLLRFLGDRR